MRPHQPVVVSIGRAFGITGLFLAIQLGITIAIGAFLGVKAVFDDAPLGDLSDLMTADLPVMLLVANSLAAFAVVSIELRRQKLPWLFNRAGSVSAAWLLPPVVLAAVGNAFIAGVVLHGLIQVFPSLGELPPMFQGLFDLARHPVIVPLTLVVVAPVTEETIFRALILGGLLRTRRPRTAILISAALFSGMHLNLGQVPATFLIGLVYGWIFYRTRSLSLCILAHGLHNGLALLVTAHELSQLDPVLVEDTVPWLALLATGAVHVVDEGGLERAERFGDLGASHEGRGDDGVALVGTEQVPVDVDVVEAEGRIGLDFEGDLQVDLLAAGYVGQGQQWRGDAVDGDARCRRQSRHRSSARGELDEGRSVRHRSR